MEIMVKGAKSRLSFTSRSPVMCMKIISILFKQTYAHINYTLAKSACIGSAPELSYWE